MSSSTMQGFKVLPLIFSSKNTSYHDVFIKEHSIRTRDALKPPGQTLFMLNVPPIATEIGLRNAFSSVGNIKRIIFENELENQNDGFKRAYLVFNTREHLLKAIKLDTLNPLSTENRPVKIGLSQWIEKYNNGICDPASLQEQINNFMASFDKREKNVKKEVVDDEGWTLVEKAGRRPGLSRKESVTNKLNEKVQEGAKKKELKDFYRHQKRESKMKEIATLRKNLEVAKNKVQLMKQTRKFKPY